jgi:Tol biopolymer transport system component
VNQIWLIDLATGRNFQVTRGDKSSSSPRWSSDGQWLTFCAEPPGTSDNVKPYVVKADGTGFSQVPISGKAAWSTFSPDGSQIAFAPPSGNLYTVKVDGTGLQNYGFNAGFGRWSPDGKDIAYCNWGMPSYNSDLLLYNFSAGTSTKIASGTPGRGFTLSAWSPDSTKLAVEVNNHSGSVGRGEIWTLNRNGSGLLNLTSDWSTSSQESPSWSSDGQHIIFKSDKSGNSDIWSMNPDGTNRVNITNTPAVNETMPALAPTQRKLHALCVGVNWGFIRCDLNADSLAATLRNASPSWASTNRAGGLNFVAALNDGSNLRKFTDEYVSMTEKVSPGDTVVLFFSTHGDSLTIGPEPAFSTQIQSGGPTEMRTGNEFMCLGDEQGSNPEADRLYDDVLANLLRNAKLSQAKKIVILEACRSGGFGPDIASSVSNVAVLAGCSEGGFCQVDPQGRGIFSNTVILGLTRRADGRLNADGAGGRPQDGIVTIDELSDCAV